MKLTATNISAAPQGVHTLLGLQFIPPGLSRTFEPDLISLERLLASSVLLIEKVDEPIVVEQVDEQTPVEDEGAPEDEKPGEVVQADEIDAELLEAATDEELAEMHLAKFGKAPHHAAKRATIIAKLVAPAEAEG